MRLLGELTWTSSLVHHSWISGFGSLSGISTLYHPVPGPSLRARALAKPRSFSEICCGCSRSLVATTRDSQSRVGLGCFGGDEHAPHKRESPSAAPPASLASSAGAARDRRDPRRDGSCTDRCLDRDRTRARPATDRRDRRPCAGLRDRLPRCAPRRRSGHRPR